MSLALSMQSHISALSVPLDGKLYHQINWDLQDKNQPLTSSKSNADCEQFQHQIRLKDLLSACHFNWTGHPEEGPWHCTFSGAG